MKEVIGAYTNSFPEMHLTALIPLDWTIPQFWRELVRRWQILVRPQLQLDCRHLEFRALYDLAHMLQLFAQAWGLVG